MSGECGVTSAVVKRERTAAGVLRDERRTCAHDRTTVLGVTCAAGEVVVRLGPPRDRSYGGDGQRIGLSPAEAAHVAGLLLAAAAEVKP